MFRSLKHSNTTSSTAMQWQESQSNYEKATTKRIGTIYLSDNEQKDLIRRAMKEIEHHTCVRFVRKRASDEDYLSIESGSGCATPVGRRGGKQVSAKRSISIQKFW